VDVNIRPMTLEDIEQVHQIDVLSFSLPWPERSFRFELSENRSSRLWVAEVTDEAGNAG
jgi:[ribosomal protein S18]-alanine N-acetyltransferase